MNDVVRFDVVSVASHLETDKWSPRMDGLLTNNTIFPLLLAIYANRASRGSRSPFASPNVVPYLNCVLGCDLLLRDVL